MASRALCTPSEEDVVFEKMARTAFEAAVSRLRTFTGDVFVPPPSRFTSALTDSTPGVRIASDSKSRTASDDTGAHDGAGGCGEREACAFQVLSRVQPCLRHLASVVRHPHSRQPFHSSPSCTALTLLVVSCSVRMVCVPAGVWRCGRRVGGVCCRCVARRAQCGHTRCTARMDVSLVSP